MCHVVFCPLGERHHHPHLFRNQGAHWPVEPDFLGQHQGTRGEYHIIWPNGIVFHQPGFPWNKEISLPKRYLLGAQVVWGRYNLTKYHTGAKQTKRVLEVCRDHTPTCFQKICGLCLELYLGEQRYTTIFSSQIKVQTEAIGWSTRRVWRGLYTTKTSKCQPSKPKL